MAITLGPRGRFAERVRARRLEAGWTQQELAEHAGVSKAFVGLIERRKQNISLGRAEKLATALGLTLSDMIYGPESGPRLRFAERMRRRREELGWTLKELAKVANVDVSFLGSVERGANNVSIAKADQIANALGVTLEKMVSTVSRDQQEGTL